MKFAISAAAVLAFIGSALAQATSGFDAITYPTDQELLSAGSTYTITWDPTASYNGQTVSILLLEGATQDTLLVGPTIAASIDSALGKYSWTVDSSVVGSALYGLKLQLDSNTSIYQYSFPFHIQGSTTSSTTTTSASSTATFSLTTSTSTTSASSTSSTTSSSGSSITTASITSTTQVTTTSTAASTTATGSAPGGNSSATGGVTTFTTLSKPSSTGSATTSASPTFATAGAAKVAAGSFMAIGGVMAAVLAI